MLISTRLEGSRVGADPKGSGRNLQLPRAGSSLYYALREDVIAFSTCCPCATASPETFVHFELRVFREYSREERRKVRWWNRQWAGARGGPNSRFFRWARAIHGRCAQVKSACCLIALDFLSTSRRLCAFPHRKSPEASNPGLL